VHQNKRDVDEEYGQLESRCECGDATSGSIKCGEFLDWLRNGKLLKKDSTLWSVGYGVVKVFQLEWLNVV